MILREVLKRAYDVFSANNSLPYRRIIEDIFKDLDLKNYKDFKIEVNCPATNDLRASCHNDQA